MHEIITHSEQETQRFGFNFAAQLQSGDIVLLRGELGAGKTTLVKGIANGLGVRNNIVSPTFTLMNIYGIGNLKSEIKKLIHIDTYRLKNEQELIDIGIEDYLGRPGTVTIIEWPEKLHHLLKNKKTISILLEQVNEGRKLAVTSRA